MGDWRNICNAALVINLFICLVFSLPGVASQREYIEAIKADVDEFSTGSFDAPEDSASWTGADSENLGGSEINTESLESFSDFLKKESPGTYIFYRKLPLEFKKKIFEEYLTLGDIERTKQSVLRYSSSRHKN